MNTQVMCAIRKSGFDEYLMEAEDGSATFGPMGASTYFYDPEDPTISLAMENTGWETGLVRFVRILVEF